MLACARLFRIPDAISPPPAAAIAGARTPARKFDVFGEQAVPGLCCCGQPADGDRRTRGQCPDREEHPSFQKSEHMVEMAKSGAERTPCFWLRCCPPKSWKTPPPCYTQYVKERFGELDVGPVHAAPDSILIACGDCSAGAVQVKNQMISLQKMWMGLGCFRYHKALSFNTKQSWRSLCPTGRTNAN